MSKIIIMVIVLTGAIAGCQMTPSTSNKPIQKKGNNGHHYDIPPATYLFHTTLQAKGTFKPGEPIQLSVSVRAYLPAKGVNVKLFIPAIYALKHQKPGQPPTIPMCKKLTPSAQWSQSVMSKDQVLKEKKTITVKQPGYYHVILSVKAKKVIPPIAGGAKRSASNNLWLLITKNGGTATKNFKHSFIPENMRAQAGPLTKKQRRPFCAGTIVHVRQILHHNKFES